MEAMEAMEEDDPIPIPTDELYASGAALINGHGKNIAIIGSTLAIVSFIASSALIFVIFRSKQRLSTTYNRLVFGLSVGDILFSLSLATFNTMAPIDDSYYIWNVHGNQASCSAQGFVLFAGGCTGLYYSCSLNLYYLFIVRYQCTDRYIRSKIEPFLHGVPIAFALILATTLLANNNINSGKGGNCNQPVYDPPHCIGYEDGEIREGFTIPCNRGKDGAVLFYYVSGILTYFMVPLIIGISLGMIYRSVLVQEKKIARYGAGALVLSTQPPTQPPNTSGVNDRPSRHSLSSRLGSRLSTIKSNRSTKKNTQSTSRKVMHRAFAYGCSFFLTWTFIIIALLRRLTDTQPPTPVVLWYLQNIFNPLQGVFTFTIFMYPKVSAAKSKGGEGVTWFQAFATAFWSTEIKNAKKNREQINRVVNEQQAVNKEMPQIIGQSYSEEEKNEIEAPKDESSGLQSSLSIQPERSTDQSSDLQSSLSIQPERSPDLVVYRSDDLDQEQLQLHESTKMTEQYYKSALEIID